ncbi:MAG: HI0074 family nucleotidyltransferase substrate-binding subunit [bacterium]
MKNLAVAQQAFRALQESLDAPYSTIVRDSCLLRFTCTFGVCWKLLKKYLAVQMGLICNSPKICIREAFKNGLFGEHETERWLMMVDDRNQIAHSYVEAVAEAIYNRLPRYTASLKSFLGALRIGIEKT